MGFHKHGFRGGGVGHVIQSCLGQCRALLTAFSRAPKLWLAALALSACANPPFGTPQPYPGHPIITSGYFSLSDGTRLPYRRYPAQGPLKAVVLALHGYTDSRDAWVTLAQTLTPHGIELIAPDQSSFGAAPNRGHWPGTPVMLAEAADMARQVRAAHPGVKFYLLGESMGGAELLLLGAAAHPPLADGYIISAPAVWGGATMPWLYRASLWALTRLDPGKRLYTHRALVTASDNQAALIAFGEDPLTLHAPRADQLAGLVDLMDQALAACSSFRQPALILYGGHDQLVPKSAMRACWRALPPTAPVTLAYYPPDYHLITRDLARATPNADILAFIQGAPLPSDAASDATVFLAQE